MSELFNQDVARSFNREINKVIDRARAYIATQEVSDEERQRYLTTVFANLNLSVD